MLIVHDIYQKLYISSFFQYFMDKEKKVLKVFYNTDSGKQIVMEYPLSKYTYKQFLLQCQKDFALNGYQKYSYLDFENDIAKLEDQQDYQYIQKEMKKNKSMKFVQIYIGKEKKKYVLQIQNKAKHISFTADQSTTMKDLRLFLEKQLNTKQSFYLEYLDEQWSKISQEDDQTWSIIIEEGFKLRIRYHKFLENNIVLFKCPPNRSQKLKINHKTTFQAVKDFLFEELNKKDYELFSFDQDGNQIQIDDQDSWEIFLEECCHLDQIVIKDIVPDKERKIKVTFPPRNKFFYYSMTKDEKISEFREAFLEPKVKSNQYEVSYKDNGETINIEDEEDWSIFLQTLFESNSVLQINVNEGSGEFVKYVPKEEALTDLKSKKSSDLLVSKEQFLEKEEKNEFSEEEIQKQEEHVERKSAAKRVFSFGKSRENEREKEAWNDDQFEDGKKQRCCEICLERQSIVDCIFCKKCHHYTWLGKNQEEMKPNEEETGLFNGIMEVLDQAPKKNKTTEKLISFLIDKIT